jgi:arylsulfatase A-like enzyme
MREAQPQMKRRGWREFGIGFLVAGAVALVAAAVETALFSAIVSGPPRAADFPYAILLHLAAALGLTLLLRAASWRAPRITFPALALAGMLAVELGGMSAYWLSRTGLLPPTYTLGGRAAVAITGLIGAGLAILAGRIAGRPARSEAWMRAARDWRGLAGIGLAIAVALAGGIVTLRAMPRAARVAVRDDAAGMQRPDVFIILVDTLRRDHLGAFGYERPTSPNIDRLLSESYVFTAAQTPSTWTIPSVASLFTGLYPSAHRIATGADRVPQDAPLLAEHFRSYGYRTAAFVGNEIVTGSNGYAQGFDRFFPPPSPWWAYHQRTAFERIVTRMRKPASAAREWRLNQEVLRWLRATPDVPHLVYIHYLDPHSPYEPSAGDLRAVAPGAPDGPADPPLFRDYEHLVADPSCRDWECLAEPPALSADETAGMVARYDGEIHHTDRRIGDLLAQLRAMGTLDRSHILLLTDHGEQFGEHGGWCHGHGIYEEMIGSPMAYRPPGGLAESRRITRPTALLDLPYTLCRILGLETPPLHQGRDIPELLGQQPPAHPVPVLSELPPSLYALRLDHWKLIRRGSVTDADWRLYDMARDPLELTNLAAQQPDTLALLQGYLEGKLAEVSKIRLATIGSSSDPELLDRLKSLGYIR